MNEEYLWNKTGSDPEIEHLEKTLTVFRHPRDAKPPVLTAAADVKPAPRWRFPLAFAFAACAAVAFGAVIWLQFANSRDPETMVTYVALPQVEETTPNEPNEVTPDAAPAQPAKPAAPAPRRSRQKVETTVARTVRRPKKIYRDNLVPKGIASLTKEERYAYGQLMLALSITSSKLKIVQDTINGTEPEKNYER